MTTKNTNTENIEEAIVVDDQPQSKALTIVIDPDNKQNTTIGFALDNKEISLQTIADKIKEYEAIEINGFLDKPNYNKVKQAKSDLLKTRTTLAKVAKARVIDPINNYLSAYKANLKEVSDALQAGQDKMDQKLKNIDEAFEKHQREEEEKQQARIQGRVTALTSLGAIFDPEQGIYTFGYDAGLIINSIQLKDFDDEEYNDFIATATQSYNNEQERIKKEEADKEAERVRLLSVEAEATAGKVKARTRELTRMGAALNVDGIFVYQDHDIVPDALKTFTEDEWEELIDKLENPVVVEEVLTEPVAAVIEPVVPKNETPENFGRFTIRPADDLPEDDDIKEQKVQITFTTESPFRVHYFKKSTMLIYSAEFEAETKAGLENVKIVDQGELADTGLMFLLIQKQQ